MVQFFNNFILIVYEPYLFRMSLTKYLLLLWMISVQVCCVFFGGLKEGKKREVKMHTMLMLMR